MEINDGVSRSRRKILEEQDVRKASGPDGVSNWMTKECSHQIAGKVHIIVNSLTEGKISTG